MFMGYYFYLENYIFIFYRNNDNKPFFDIYRLKGFKAIQTLELDEFLVNLLKLNENELIVCDCRGNIQVCKRIRFTYNRLYDWK